MLTAIANIGKAVSITAFVSTAPSLTIIFADSVNLAGVTAKHQAQYSIVDALAIAVAVLSTHICCKSPRALSYLPCVAYCICSFLSMYTIKQESKVIIFRYLNECRLVRVTQDWVRNQSIPTPQKVAAEESSILFNLFGRNGQTKVKIGRLEDMVESPEDLDAMLSRHHTDAFYISVHRRTTPSEILISFKEGHRSQDSLLAFLMAAFAAHELERTVSPSRVEIRRLLERSVYKARNQLTRFQESLMEKGWDLNTISIHLADSQLIGRFQWANAAVTNSENPQNWPTVVSRALSEKDVYFFSAQLFPEIDEACVTVNSRLYLWKLNHSTTADPIPREIRIKNQGILSVALTPLRTGFKFNARLQPNHVFTVTTTQQVLMIGLFESRVLSLLSRYSCSTNGVQYEAIAVSRGGRIFCGGSDGHLYEVLYYTTSGFLYESGGLQLVKQTWWFKDIFLDCPVKQQIGKLKLDDERHWLYLVRKIGTVELFTLGEDGVSRPQRLMCFDPRQGMPQSTVLCLDPVPLHRSKTIVLIVTFQDGRKRFYRVLEMDKNNQKIKVELAYDLDAPEEQQCALQCINRSFDSGFLVSTDGEGINRRSSLTQFSFNSLMKSEFQEVCHSIALDAPGRPLCIKQYPVSELSETFSECEMTKDEFHLQLFSRNSRFCLMTREVVIRFDKLYPARHLRWILRTKDTNLLVKFVEFYGSLEVAAMCWAIGTDQWDLVEPVFAIPDLFQLADFADHSGTENLQTQSLHSEIGDTTTLNKLKHSDIFGGFCLYISRLLKPIWKRVLFKGNQIQWKYDLLMFYYLQLKKLTYFLTRTVNEARLYDLKQKMVSDGSETSGIAADYEVAALRQRRSFLGRCLEGIQILMLLQRREVRSDEFDLTPQDLEELIELDFGSFLQYRTPVIKVVTAFCASPACPEEETDNIRSAAPSFFCPPSQLDQVNQPPGISLI
eukprot:g2046.t1